MRIIKNIFFTLLLIAFLTPFLILAYFLVGQNYDISSVVNYKPNITTRFYDKNSQKIANIFEGEHRYYAHFNEIPPKVVEALLAIEDTTFFEHSGINVDAILEQS